MPSTRSFIVEKPKRGGRLAFKAFLTASLLALIAGAAAQDKTLRGLGIVLAFGLGAAYTIGTLKRWGKQKETVRGKSVAWAAAGLMLIMACSGFMLIGATDTNDSRQNITTKQSGHSFQPSADFCKNFPFDETCPNHEQYRASAENARTHAQSEAFSHPNPETCLQMVRGKDSEDGFGTTIRGKLTNRCGREFRYVQISFKLFDRAGNVVGSALANQNNLGDGETWKFAAYGTPSADHDAVDEIVKN